MGRNGDSKIQGQCKSAERNAPKNRFEPEAQQISLDQCLTPVVPGPGLCRCAFDGSMGQRVQSTGLIMSMYATQVQMNLMTQSQHLVNSNFLKSTLVKSKLLKSPCCVDLEQQP